MGTFLLYVLRVCLTACCSMMAVGSAVCWWEKRRMKAVASALACAATGGAAALLYLVFPHEDGEMTYHMMADHPTAFLVTVIVTCAVCLYLIRAYMIFLFDMDR